MESVGFETDSLNSAVLTCKSDFPFLLGCTVHICDSDQTGVIGVADEGAAMETRACKQHIDLVGANLNWGELCTTHVTLTGQTTRNLMT